MLRTTNHEGPLGLHLGVGTKRLDRRLLSRRDIHHQGSSSRLMTSEGSREGSRGLTSRIGNVQLTCRLTDPGSGFQGFTISPLWEYSFFNDILNGGKELHPTTKFLKTYF